MTGYDFKFVGKPTSKEEFSEASAHELKVLVALYESGGAITEDELVLRAGVSRARVLSALALWQEAGVIAERGEEDERGTAEVSFFGSTLTDEFPERTVLGELEEESAREIAATIRNNKLSSLFDEIAAMMNKAMLTPAEIRRISELSSQYGLSEEYIATLAAHLLEENMLSVGILIKRAMNLAGGGVANTEALVAYIADKEREKNDYLEYKRIFGIFDRRFSKREKEYIEKWSREYCYGTEIVGMAYDITVINISKLSFAYMDKLLCDWFTHGCKTLSECEARYEENKREKEAEAAEKKASSEARRGERKPKQQTARFGDFDPEEAFRLALQRSFAETGSGGSENKD